MTALAVKDKQNILNRKLLQGCKTTTALTGSPPSVDAGVLASHRGEAEGVHIQGKTRRGLCCTFRSKACLMSNSGARMQPKGWLLPENRLLPRALSVNHLYEGLVFFFFLFSFSSSRVELSLKSCAYSFELTVQIKTQGESIHIHILDHLPISSSALSSMRCNCTCLACLWFEGWTNKCRPWPSLWWVLLQVECRNYIRTLHRVNDTTLYVCGTNAFSPVCDYLVSVLYWTH